MQRRTDLFKPLQVNKEKLKTENVTSQTENDKWTKLCEIISGIFLQISSNLSFLFLLIRFIIQDSISVNSRLVLPVSDYN